MPLADDPAAPFEKSWDVYGDGSISVISTPGHTQGPVCIQVSGTNGFALLVGDTGYNPASWQSLKLPGPVYDEKEMRKALAWVRDRARIRSAWGSWQPMTPKKNGPR